MKVEFFSTPSIRAEVKDVPAIKIEMKNISIDGNTPMYTGQYDVIPSFTEQRLNTAGKKMIKDVSVEEIQVYEVMNPQGGVTLSI